jgi:sulfur-oxidizing protein SoxB
VSNSEGDTLVTNAGSNGKFIGVLDLIPDGKRIRREYRLMPIFADLIEPDRPMKALIERVRAPYEARLKEPLAVADRLLYRRGNFTGTFDELILAALVKETGCEIALSPGFRWGTCVLPGDVITYEDVMAQTAITYPQVQTRELTGAEIKDMLEDVADNLFNPDPYYRQGGDMVRVGGLKFSCDPQEQKGRRIDRLTLGDESLSSENKYRVTNWAPVNEVVKGESVSTIVLKSLGATNQI